MLIGSMQLGLLLSSFVRLITYLGLSSLHPAEGHGIYLEILPVTLRNTLILMAVSAHQSRILIQSIPYGSMSLRNSAC